MLQGEGQVSLNCCKDGHKGEAHGEGQALATPLDARGQHQTQQATLAVGPEKTFTVNIMFVINKIDITFTKVFLFWID